MLAIFIAQLILCTHFEFAMFMFDGLLAFDSDRLKSLNGRGSKILRQLKSARENWKSSIFLHLSVSAAIFKLSQHFIFSPHFIPSPCFTPSPVRSPQSAVVLLYWPVSDMCLWHCWYMYSPLVSFFPVAYLSCSKTTTVLGRLGGSAMFFKHLVSWKFARVHLQNAGWHSIFTLLRSSANVRHDFFILHVCSLRSVLFRADTSSMHCSDEQKFTRSPKISF